MGWGLLFGYLLFSGASKPTITYNNCLVYRQHTYCETLKSCKYVQRKCHNLYNIDMDIVEVRSKECGICDVTPKLFLELPKN